MLHMIVRLPNGNYYVPSMNHSPKVSNGPSKEERDQYLTNLIPESYSKFTKQYKFQKYPFGLQDRVLVRILHFPNMEIEGVHSADYYVVKGNDYLVRIQNPEDSVLLIDLFVHRPSIGSSSLAFFFHFVFESTEAVLNTFKLPAHIERVEIFRDDEFIGTETALIQLTANGLISSYSDVVFGDIERLDGSCARFERRLSEGSCGVVWKGSLDPTRPNIVFKEIKNSTCNTLRGKELIKEIVLMQRFKGKYTTQLIGICPFSQSLQESKMRITGESINRSCDILIGIEWAPLGDLVQCKEQLCSKSVLLKLKIILDVARGLQALQLADGVKLIHRDVRSQNILVFSLDESTVHQLDSVHAKLGDFGCVVVGSPSYSQRLGNYQYTAPEALQGSLRVPYTSKIDVYSLGIVLWEILSGEIPFMELRKSNVDPQYEIIHGYRPKLEDLRVVPADIISLIKQCWAAEPYKRPTIPRIIALLSNMLQLYSRRNTSMLSTVQRTFDKRVDNMETALHLQEMFLIKKPKAKDFTNIEFKGNGCNGLVMICTITVNEVAYTVALKMITNLHAGLSTVAHIQKCANEFHILPSLAEGHPNIIRMIGEFTDRPTDEMIQQIDSSIRDLCYHNTKLRNAQFFILEQYENTLDSIVASLSVSEIKKLIIQLAEGLDYLYRNRIVHLDIKMDNLMLSSTKKLVIVDFGVAGRLLEDDLVDIGSTTGGNVLHLAPEVLIARKRNENLPCSRQHSWELGMILYQLLTKGQFPFDDYVENHFQFPVALDVERIPTEFVIILQGLLCEQEHRMPIDQAISLLKELLD